MLRFGTIVNPDFMRPILNYQSIAKVIKKPVTTVIEIVKFAIKSLPQNPKTPMISSDLIG